MTKNKVNGAFTLVEVLVVITIVGVISAIVLPGIQAAREAARRVECKNHLKQLGLAALAHHEQIGHFPTSGWGWRWVGDGDRGFGKDQPGNWTYNLLPFEEEQSLYDLVKDGLPNQISQQQLQGAKRLVETPIGILYCPSRRAPSAYPHIMPEHAGYIPINTPWAAVAGKVDYAINNGDTLTVPRDSGPDSHRDSVVHPWRFSSTGAPTEFEMLRHTDVNYRDPWFTSQITGQYEINGISFARSEIALRHVTDGASNTYLIGERYMDAAHSEDGLDGAHPDGWCTALHAHGTAFRPPLRDLNCVHQNRIFGSAHVSGLHMTYCDGSVRTIEYGVDLAVHRAAANRKDATAHGIGISNEFWTVPGQPAPPRPPR